MISAQGRDVQHLCHGTILADWRSGTRGRPYRGKVMPSRILIVEDEPIVALNYASILEDAGCDVVGPISTISKGIEVIERERLDGAVLDIDLGGVPVDPIVMALQQKSIPYIFVSAFPDRIGPYKDAVLLEKPCMAVELMH